MAPLILDEYDGQHMYINDGYHLDDDYSRDDYEDELVWEETRPSHELTLDATTAMILSSAIPNYPFHRQAFRRNDRDSIMAARNDHYSIYLRHQANDSIIRYRHLNSEHHFRRRCNSIPDHMSQSICKLVNDNYSNIIFAMAQSLCADAYSAKLTQLRSDGCILQITVLYHIETAVSIKEGKSDTDSNCSMMQLLQLKNASKNGNKTTHQEMQEYLYPFESMCFEEYHIWYEMMIIYQKLNSPKITWLLDNPLSAMYLFGMRSLLTRSEWVHWDISFSFTIWQNTIFRLLSFPALSTLVHKPFSCYEIGKLLWMTSIYLSIMIRLYYVVDLINYNYRYLSALSRRSNHNATNSLQQKPEKLFRMSHWITSILVVGLPAAFEYLEFKSIHHNYISAIKKISKENDVINWDEY